MNETLWIVTGLFIFAVVAQLVLYFYRLRRSLHLLEDEVGESTQTIFETRQKMEWLEARLDDLLDAAQLGSDDTQTAWQRIQQVSQRVTAEARHKGYRVGIGDIDQTG